MGRIWCTLVCSLLSLALWAGTAHTQTPTISTTLSAEPGAYSGACPTDIKFKGNITSEKAGKVQFRFVRSDGILQPVETLEFSTPGAKEVSSIWSAVGEKIPAFEGWEMIKILYPEEVESNKSVFKVKCDKTSPDLTVKIKHCPKIVKPGSELGSVIKVVAANRGGGTVKDVSIDVVLKKDNSCPVPLPEAVYSNHFSNGVLLRGGHEQISLNADEKQEVNLNGSNTIPADTPTGEYFLCALIDAGNRIKESNESDNCSCCPVKVTTAIGKPDLIIEKFAFKGWGRCEPNAPIFSFEVTVKNIGNASSPAITDKAVLTVMDLHGNNWGNSVGMNAIPPGKSLTIVIPVYYLSEDPAHMTKVVPHPFRAFVDPYHMIDELNENNNKSDIIYLDPSLVCSRTNRN